VKIREVSVKVSVKVKTRFQKHRYREDSWRFREDIREGFFLHAQIS